jgi:outer membrane protein OmpA-like peptidoglycan-associated protein
MNSKVAIFTGILILWMGASTYWYVCKIKKDCQKNVIVEQISSGNKSRTSDTVNLQIEIQKTETDERNQILREKLSKGISLSGFPYNSPEYENFSDEFNNFVRDLKTYLQLNAGETVQVIGYTDNKGNELMNIKLSNKRAQFIKALLLEQGINEEQIIIKGEGENNPVADNNTDAGRAQNRRVEIKLSKN